MATVDENQQEPTRPVRRKKTRKRLIRRVLLTIGPVAVLAVAAYVYLVGGRYVSTDNSYVQADKVSISPDVSGTIVTVLVHENEDVVKGAPLFRIDDQPYRISLAKAKANLQAAEANIRELKATYRQKIGQEELALSDIDFTRREFNRQKSLNSSRVLAQAELDKARHDLQSSEHQLDIIRAEMAEILARLEGDPDIAADRLASYRQARAEMEQAAFDLDKTVVRAPFAGRVSKIPKPGKYVAPGTPVLALVADSTFWVEANLKETELTHVQVGQSATIEVDTYPDFTFNGTVTSISPATGSEFSVIPPQNASGNWVKIVQRIPVRISVDNPSKERKLISGMSAYVDIDTKYHHRLPDWLAKGLGILGIGSDTVASAVSNG
ncbi:MAG: HlyD family secretion protein [Desulfopila sp.]